MKNNLRLTHYDLMVLASAAAEGYEQYSSGSHPLGKNEWLAKECETLVLRLMFSSKKIDCSFIPAFRGYEDIELSKNVLNIYFSHCLDINDVERAAAASALWVRLANAIDNGEIE